jgi:hypothetical protein
VRVLLTGNAEKSGISQSRSQINSPRELDLVSWSIELSNRTVLPYGATCMWSRRFSLIVDSVGSKLRQKGLTLPYGLIPYPVLAPLGKIL